MATEIHPPQLDELTVEDARNVLDEAAQRYLGITGEEFVKAWEAGYFDNDADRPEVTRVAMLLPFGR